MECINNAVPKLFYTAGAETLAFADTLTGYNPVFYKLPELNPYVCDCPLSSYSGVPIPCLGLLAFPWKTVPLLSKFQ